MGAPRAIIGLTVLVGLGCGSNDSGDRAATGPSSGTVVVDGAELTWVREGDGPPVFVLGSAIYYPRAYSQELRRHFELVFVDGRHFVPDYAPDGEALREVDLSTFAHDVDVVRRALGYGRVSVIGHSIHGQIALEYADRYPESVSSLVLVAAVPYSFSELAEENERVWEELATPERRAVLAERLETLQEVVAVAPPTRSFATDYAHRSPIYWADPEYDASSLLAGLENGPAFSRLAGTLPSREAARARLERIEPPVLLVLGKLDFAVAYTAWEELIEGLEGVDYVLLEEDGHNPQTESPDRFDPILIRWLEAQ